MSEGFEGFYYDLQKENPLMKVTLHPNTIAEYDDNGKFTGFPPAKNNIDEEGYLIEPICSSIMNEDFAVAIANSWSETGGDPIGSLWNSFKPLAPYSDFMSDAIKGLVGKKEEWENTAQGQSNKRNSAMVRALSWAIDKLRDVDLDKASEYLNSSLVVQGSRFSYYQGTGVSFSNMVMKFTLFSEFSKDGNNSVSNQLRKILPYAMGHWESLTEDIANDSNLDDLKNFIGFEKPPGGYRSNIRSIDFDSDKGNIQGTLKLKFGPYYSIRNLVVSDIQLNFSKQMVKLPIDTAASTEEINNSFTLEPLFCDVQLTLKPAIKFSDTIIDQFVLGTSTSSDRTRLNNELSSKLEKISEKLNEEDSSNWKGER